jgi:hypothetical protein
MPRPTSNPIPKLRLIRIGKQTPILLRRHMIRFLRHSPPLFLLPSLPLRAIIQQTRQCPTKRKYNERFQNVGIDFRFVVVVVAGGVVVVLLGVCPVAEFGFEEGAEPFGEGPLFFRS